MKIPMIGFGTYRIPSDGSACSAVSEAIAAGYRLIDTAAMYRNEAEVGRAVRNSGVGRDEIFITSKVWLNDNGYETTKAAIDASLGRLGLDYMDLYLIHQPYGDVQGAWKAMEEAKAAGKIRSIGVSNMTEKIWHEQVAHFNVKPSVNQVELNPYSQQRSIRKTMDENGCILEAWAALARADAGLMGEPALASIAGKHGKTVPQVVIRFVLQEGAIPLVKSVRPDRIRENFDVFDFQLDEEDMNVIRGLDKGHPVRDPDAPGVAEYLLSKYDFK